MVRVLSAVLAFLVLPVAPVGGAGEPTIPEKAICRVCERRGAGHGEEKVAAWREREGERYFFCSEPCGEAFDGFPAAYVTLPLPRPAPDAIVRRLDGTAARLSELEGDLVLLDFWATWCKPCVKAIPKLRELGSEFGERGFRVVGVSIDEKGLDHVRKFSDKKGLTYEVVLDDGESPAWFAYGVAAVPSAFLVDGERRIVAEWRGSTDPEAVRREIVARLGPSAP